MNEMKLWLIWTDNGIGESGARMISESLKINTILSELDLTCDDIKWNKCNWIQTSKINDNWYEQVMVLEYQEQEW